MQGMTSIASPTTSPTTRVVIGGMHSHGQTHQAAVIDEVGRPLGDREFPASPASNRALATWLGGYGTLTTMGVEGTGTDGAALARYLRTIELSVVDSARAHRGRLQTSAGACHLSVGDVGARDRGSCHPGRG